MAGYRIEAFPRSRRIIVDTGEAAGRRHPVHGLIEVDITRTVEILDGMTTPPSLTSCVAASIGLAVGQVPEVHAVRDLRNRLVIFDDVDINVMIEVELEGRSFPMNHVIRSCNTKSVVEIDNELRAIKADPGSSATMSLEGAAALYFRLPRYLRSRLVGLLHRLPHKQRQLAGTVGISSVGMFGKGGGWGIGFPVQTLSIIVGGTVVRPAFINGALEPRTFLHLSFTFDHDIVDGAPAARFVANARRLLEAGSALTDYPG